GGFDLLSLESMRIYVKDAATLVRLGVGSGADRHHTASFAANSIGVRHHKMGFVCRVWLEIQNAACKHIGSNDIHLRGLINTPALQTQHRRGGLPRGLAP